MSQPQRTAEKPEPWPWASLLVDFIASGFSEDLFWSLTPRQIEAHFAAARKRHRIERNMMMETSFLGANAANFKTPLKLADLLTPLDDRPAVVHGPQPWEQQIATLRQIMKSKRK